jgi:hypothetical protein
MIAYKLNQEKTYAVKAVDGVLTGEWHNVKTSAEYLKWLDAGNTPLLDEGNAPIGADTPLPAETPDAG